MTDQIEDLIREIAAKHGIAVARDDPILVLQTINNRLLQDSASAQQVMLDRFKEELEAVSMRWEADAKGKAERVLTSALAGSVEVMNRTVQEAAVATAEAMRPVVDVSLERVANLAESGRRAAVINILASGITFAAVGALVWIKFT
ncbi:MAG: conjugal transfer protein TraM [Burkholderiaceae bacterium]|nr:conjugal transfer protein TraM [Burkholderiaceae bacterium]